MYGHAIKEYLDENDIKYSFIAKETGIPLNVFSALLNDKRKISVEEYFRICAELNLDANYFMNKIRQVEQTPA